MQIFYYETRACKLHVIIKKFYYQPWLLETYCIKEGKQLSRGDEKKGIENTFLETCNPKSGFV